MLRQNAIILNTIKIILDILFVLLAFYFSWTIRFGMGLFAQTPHLPFERYMALLFVAVPAFVICQYVLKMYSSVRRTSILNEVYICIRSSLIMGMVIIAGIFILKLSDYARSFVIIFSAITALSVGAQRAILRLILKFFREKGFNMRYVVVLGCTDYAEKYVNAISKHREMGYKVFSVIEKIDTVLLEKTLADNIIDEVVIAIDIEEYKSLGKILEICEKSGVKSSIIPSYVNYVPSKPQIDEIDGIPLINTRYIPLDNILYSFIKNVFDFIAAFVLCTILSPVMAAVAIAVKLSSEGDILFKQKRVGFGGEPFTIYKFRTMRSDTRNDGWTVENDPRRTKVGEFLRKTNLDELPQLFNVLKGDMSLVGPRPEQIGYVKQFKEEIPKYMIKHRVKPGITGWAQVNGLRGDTSIEERIKKDIYYIENWSIGFDIKILFMTVFGKNKNAY